MKRLTLDQTWNECLAMWKWISRQTISRPMVDVYDLKVEWENKTKVDAGEDSCFFCRYGQDRLKAAEVSNCRLCPGKKVQQEFDCYAPGRTWHSQPRLFYAKLKELNRIRLSK